MSVGSVYTLLSVGLVFSVFVEPEWLTQSPFLFMCCTKSVSFSIEYPFMQKKKEKRKKKKEMYIMVSFNNNNNNNQSLASHFHILHVTPFKTLTFTYIHMYIYIFTYLLFFWLQNVGLQMVENLVKVIEYGTRDRQSDALVSYY